MNDSHKHIQNLMDYVQLEVKAKSIEFKHDPVTNFYVDLEDLRSVTYFLTTIKLPSKDSIFSELKYLKKESNSIEDIKKNIEEQINALSTMVDDAEKYKYLLKRNIPMFTLYFLILCDPNNEKFDVETLKSHELFFLKEMKEISFQISSIYDKSNQLVHYRNSPTQSIQLLVGANPPFLQEVICNIDQCISYPIFANYKKSLNAAKSLCENITDEVTLAFISSKDHYSKANFSKLLSFRNQLKEFISFTGHIDHAAKTNLSQTCSVFLYHLDNILFALSFLTPQKVTNLIDVSSTATIMINLIKDIKMGDEILTFLNTVYKAYKSNFMIQGTNQELLKFLDLITEEFERKVTLPSILVNPSKGYFLSVLFSKLCLSVSKIEFDQGIFNTKEVIFDITSLLTIMDKLNDLKPKSNYRINEYEKYYINNSKTAISLQNYGEESEISFKKFETINLDEINLDDEDKIKDIYELIKKSFPYVENNNNLNFFLVKTEKFNKIVKELNIRVNKITPYYSQSNLLNGICYILELSFSEASEISKIDDNLTSFVKKLDIMRKFYNKMKRKVTYPSISIYTKQMKEDIEFLSSKVTFDDKYRESNLSIHFETLIELLSKFVSLIGMNQTEKTNIKFIIDCVEKVTLDLSLLYQYLTIEDENFIIYVQFFCEASSYFTTMSQNLNSYSTSDVYSLIKEMSNLLVKFEDLLSLFMTNKLLYTKYCDFLSDVSKVIYSISRLESNYMNDYKIQSVLSEIKEGNDLSDEFRNLSLIYSDDSPRDGTEVLDTEIICKNSIHLLSQKMKFQNNEQYLKSDKLRRMFNNILHIIGLKEIELENIVSCISKFKNTPLEVYVNLICQNNLGTEKFFENCYQILTKNLTINEIIQKMDDYSLNIDENVINEIEEFISPSIAFYYENKNEILDNIMMFNLCIENSLQGFFNLASIAMKINEEKPKISDILVYLGTRNKKFSINCYYSAKILSNDSECIKTIYENFIPFYLDQINENKLENEFKKLSLLLFDSLPYNTILFNDQFTILYGEKYRDLNIQMIHDKISKYDSEINIIKSDIKLPENYQEFVDEIKSFDDIPIAEYLSLVLGGLTNRYIGLIQSQTETQEMKSQIKSFFYKLIENYQKSYFITNFVSHDLISLFRYFVFTLKLSTNNIWSDFISYIVSILEKCFDDEFKIYEISDFIKNLEESLIKLNDEAVFAAYNELIAAIKKNQSQQTIQDLIDLMNQMKEKIQFEIPQFLNEFDKKIAEYCQILENPPKEFYKSEEALIDIQKNMSNLKYFTQLSFKNNFEISTINFRKIIRNNKKFEIIVFRDLVDSAVDAMKEHNEDLQMTEEILSLSICADIIALNTNRRRESTQFLLDAANVVTSLQCKELIMKCAEYADGF